MYKNEYKKITDENNKEIGYIVRSNLDSRVDKYLSKMKAQQVQNSDTDKNFQGAQNLLNTKNNKNTQNVFNRHMAQNFQNNQNALNNQQVPSNPTNNEHKNMIKSPTSIINNSYVKINPELLIDPVIAFFYQIGEILS